MVDTRNAVQAFPAQNRADSATGRALLIREQTRASRICMYTSADTIANTLLCLAFFLYVFASNFYENAG